MYGVPKMECLVCRQTIHPGERIFAGTEGVCCVDSDWEGCCLDLGYSGGSGELSGVIHLSCLESPVVVTATPNMASPELVEEELVVRRSDALSLLDI